MRKMYVFVLAMLLACTQLLAQDRTVSGRVTDDKGVPVPNATVQIKGTNLGTTTGPDGSFTITVSPRARVLAISAIGLGEKEITLSDNTSYTVALSAVATNLQEVVVVGYGTQAQRTRTQTASIIRSDEFTNQPILSTTQVLQGRAAGVNMVNSSGLLGGAPNVQVRGASSLLGGTQPLYVIDGVPLNDDVISGAQGGGSGLNPLLDLNPNDVESMTVLKDAAAVAIYGSRGTNGVILIRTKRGANNQKTRINLDYYTGISNPTSFAGPDDCRPV